MMNIFIMILVALFMGTYYLISSPSLRVREQEVEYSVTRADMRSIAECTMATHNGTIRGEIFEDICVNQNDIKSEVICIDKRKSITSCDAGKNKAPDYTYIITYTKPIDAESYNDMMEILEKHYADVGTFGVFMDEQIVSGGGTKRNIPSAILKKENFQDGQLIYLTQYAMPTPTQEFETNAYDGIVCPTGMSATYRFGRWQCIPLNLKTNCAGDMIWSSETFECVPDETRKPLCAAQQTAVIVDNVWECVNPFVDKTCPGKSVARLNYNTLEWECVDDPNATNTETKCTRIINDTVSANPGGTIRVPTTSCTDCETMVVNMETCHAKCIPDETKLNDSKCYPSESSCTGESKAFYFGFPSFEYASNVNAISGKTVPFDKSHSQNRKFNCMDCGNRGINRDKSLPPYIVVCN